MYENIPQRSAWQLGKKVLAWVSAALSNRLRTHPEQEKEKSTNQYLKAQFLWVSMPTAATAHVHRTPCLQAAPPELTPATLQGPYKPQPQPGASSLVILVLRLPDRWNEQLLVFLAFYPAESHLDFNYVFQSSKSVLKWHEHYVVYIPLENSWLIKNC